MTTAMGALARRLAPTLQSQRIPLLPRASPRFVDPGLAGNITAILSQQATRALSGLAASRSPNVPIDDCHGMRSWGAGSARSPLGSAYALVPLVHVRQMAMGPAQQKGAVPPASVVGVGSGSSRQLTVTSPNVIREPYTGPAPRLQISDLTSRDGLAGVYKRYLGKAKNVYTLAKVKKDIPGWTLAGFKDEVTTLYRVISEGIASGKVADIRRHVTDMLSGELKRQVSMDQVSVVQGRLAVPLGMGTDVSFAQFTVEFESQQRFAAFNSKGELLAGGMDKVIPVREFWVFERSLVQQMSNKAWRLAGRLQVPKQN